MKWLMTMTRTGKGRRVNNTWKLKWIMTIVLGLFFVKAGVAGYILFDDSHDADGDELTGNLSSFASAILNPGHTLTELNSGPITSSILAGYDAVIIYDAEIPLSASEITVIHSFVNSGGGLWAIGENTSAFARESYNELLSPYGISFTTEDTPNSSAYPIGFHPTTQGVDSLSLTASGILSLSSGATAIAEDISGNIIGAVNDTFNGRVIVWADSNTFRDALGPNEILFAANTANWVIPEPGTVLLIGLGSVAVFKKRRQ